MTASVVLSARPASLVRSLPLPKTEPGYDDERPATRAVSVDQGALALGFTGRDHLPALRLVPRRPGEESVEGGAGLPPAGVWAGRLVQAVLEVHAGERSPAQLVRWTSEPVYTQLMRTVARPPTRGCRAVVRSVRAAALQAGVAEACVVVQRGVRCGAVALRLDAVGGRWLCTALEMG